MLQNIADHLWVQSRHLRFWGLETGTRMSIVRLADGGLFVHSPIELDDETKREVDARGPVRAIVAPSRMHHLYVGEWMSAYPKAVVCCCPTLEKKRADIPWQRILGDSRSPSGVARSIRCSSVRARSRTRCCSSTAGAARCSAPTPSSISPATPPDHTHGRPILMGGRAPGATWLERIIIRDRRAAREQIDRMLAWDFDRIVLAHGDIIETGGREVLRKAYAWL